MLHPRRTLVLCLLALAACQGPASEGDTPLHFDVGVVHRTVTTTSAEAQLWFDRGLGLAFGFNHQESVLCFERAIEADSACAMAYWGKAYALGPNYNSGGVSPQANQAAMRALAQARENLAGCTPLEHALIGALASRYSDLATRDRGSLDREYSEAMRAVYAAYPEDADVAALTAEALMQLRRWELWSADGQAAAETPAIRAVLEPALRRWPTHPALCHLYIHAMEAGPEVGKALPAARQLEELTPGLGHLIHMPSHIYTWTGRYDDVVRVNLRAVEVDDAFVDYAGSNNSYTLYRLHNLHFVAYGAMFEGRRELALDAARRIKGEIPDELLAGALDFLDVFLATPYHVMVRFGMWEEMLAEPKPKGELYAARAVWHYARGIALASMDRVADARAEQMAFLFARDAVPATRLLFNNPVREILAVADKVLAGEIAYREKDYARAFDLLRAAVALDVALNYDEPWGWMEPSRHALGALLTEQGRHAEAIEVYRANLKRYPENGWALHGLAECQRGLGRDAAAAKTEARFVRAWQRADVEIPGSCFCKSGT